MMAALLLLLLLLCLMGSLDSETVRKLAPGLLSGALSLSPPQDGKIASCPTTAPSVTARYRAPSMILPDRACTGRLIRPVYAKTVNEYCQLGVLVYFLCMYT